jgi:hypothetical protein
MGVSMKFKLDYITNSSSTAFFFIFKGDGKKELFELINKYSNKFDLREKFSDDDIYTCDANFVINGIDSSLNKKYKYKFEKCEFENIDSLIAYFEDFLERIIKLNEDTKTKKLYLYTDEINQTKYILTNLKQAKEKGLVNCLQIEFGDNRGHVSQSKESSCMDYAKPVIIEDDFYLLNRSCH